MQERYLGDIHDFMKLHFIEFVSKKIKKKIGLNWYLTDPKNIGNNELSLNHGEQRKFVSEQKYLVKNKKLINELKNLVKKKNRLITNYTKNSYLNSYLNFYNKKITLSNRQKWFENSLFFFKHNDVLFLDPDNGLITKSVSISSKKSIKYISYNEIKKLYNSGKTIIFCQFQSFNVNHKLMLKNKISEIYEHTHIKINSPIIRNRCSPNTFFISIIQENYKKKLNSVFRSFCHNHDWTQLVEL
ncbi:hypothetical protein OA848_01680 [Rickettsiales bacterium]|nr:hypothetical protein [Rickettsiales bacterium]